MPASHQPEGVWSLHYNRHTFSHNNQSFQPRHCRNQPFDAQELSRRLLAVQAQQQKQEQQELQKQQKQHHKLQKLQASGLRKRQSMPLPRRLFSSRENTAPKADTSNPESHTSHHTADSAPKSASSTRSSSSGSSSSSNSKVDDSRRSSTSGSALATSISTSTSLSSQSQQQSSKPERSSHHNHSSDQQRQHSASSACGNRIATEEDEFGTSPAYMYRRKTYSRGSQPERAGCIEGDEAKARKKIWSRSSIMGLKHRLGGNGSSGSSHDGGKQEAESLAGEAPHQQRAGLLRRFRKTPTA